MDEPRTLQSVFAQAEERRLALERAVVKATDPSYRDALAAAVADYTECQALIAQLRLFSPNDAPDDLATAALPYLLVPYHLAELALRAPAAAPRERRQALARARRGHERFLRALDGHGLLAPAHARLLEAYADGPAAFSTTAPAAAADPAARRNAKIANFRAEQALKQKLAYLREHPAYGDVDGGGGGGDEEVVRSVHLANIALSAHLAFQQLESMNREAEVLALAPEPLIQPSSTVEEDERRRRQSLKQDSFSERLDAPLQRLQSFHGPILSKEGKPLQPFTIVGTRQDLAKRVFRPGHNLPTMSIDDYLDEEKRRGGIIEGGGEASWHRPEPDEDDEQMADVATMKARVWDEFTESNARGSGNTLNRG